MPDDFTRQRETLGGERVNMWIRKSFHGMVKLNTQAICLLPALNEPLDKYVLQDRQSFRGHFSSLLYIFATDSL